MESSPNQNTEPMSERERRVLEHIDYVLADYDRFNTLGQTIASDTVEISPSIPTVTYPE